MKTDSRFAFQKDKTKYWKQRIKGKPVIAQHEYEK